MRGLFILGVSSILAGLLSGSSAGAYTVSVTTTQPTNMTLFDLDADIGQSMFNVPPSSMFMGDALVYAASDQFVGERLAPGATSAYIAVEPTANQVFIEGGLNITSFAMELFTFDDYNVITFNTHTAGDITFTGADLSALSGISADGVKTVWLEFTGLPDFNGITFTSTRIAEEFIPGSIIGTPELSTWAMMLLGFVGLGFFGARKAKLAAI